MICCICFTVPARAQDALTKALDYYKQPAKLIQRATAVEMFLAAADETSELQLKAAIYGYIGEAYRSRFNREVEQKDLQSAAYYYRIGLSFAGTSLRASKLKLLLAEVLRESGDLQAADSLLCEIIKTRNDDIYPGELTDVILDRLSGLSRNEERMGVSKTSFVHKLQVDHHIAIYKSNIDHDHFRIRATATQRLAIAEYKSGGITALERFVSGLNDEDLKPIGEKILTEKAQPHP